MKVSLIEPFFSGSHKSWAEGLARYSSHEINIISLKGIHWKWRMHGAAITLYSKFKEQAELPELILVTDMLDLALFKAQMTQEEHAIPIAIYFHENQLTYPWSSTDSDVSNNRNRHYGFINYTSSLIADKVFFNSRFHRRSFLGALPSFLGAFPDHQNMSTIKKIESKSEVLHLGLELQDFTDIKIQKDNDTPVIMWNHRWEYDKNPVLFFNTLISLKTEGVKFRLIVCGESYRNYPEIFDHAKAELKEEIDHWGFVESKEEYIKLVQLADLLPICSKQDFFGISIAEGLSGGAYPLLPNRLSFPELVLSQEYFYNNDDEFVEKLKQIIDEKKYKLNKPKLVRDIIKYDWESKIDEYDKAFTDVLALKTKN